jgi:hypothetical protein
MGILVFMRASEIKETLRKKQIIWVPLTCYICNVYNAKICGKMFHKISAAWDFIMQTYCISGDDIITARQSKIYECFIPEHFF